MKTNENLKILIAILLGVLTVELPRAKAQTQVPNYAVIDLGALNGTYSYSTAYGINNSGQVVGSTRIDYLISRAFLYSGGIMRDLGILSGGSNSIARGINDSGQVVGYSDNGSATHAVLYTNGVMYDLGTFGGSYSAAYGINNSGQIVGRFYSNSNYRAFLYANGSAQDLGTLGGNYSDAYGINNGGQVVGTAQNSYGDYHAFSSSFPYTNGSMRDLGAMTEIANGINASGQIVGRIVTNSGYHAFLSSFPYTNNDSLWDLGTLGGTSSYAYAINASGQVVGGAQTSSGSSHAFIYVSGTMYDLNNLALTNSGWTIQVARGINDAGQIAGTGINPLGQTHAFRLDPLPAGWREKIEAQPAQPTYGTCPSKEAGKDSLIVVTHGWIRLLDSPQSSTAWVDDMTNSITQYLLANHMDNWQVIAYKWIEKAQTLFPWQAANYGEQEGEKLGDCISIQGWSHVHLIAHSAGSALIQAVSAKIKVIPSPTAVVHATFLDAYTRIFHNDREKYGDGADWADSYFSRDTETGSFTEGPLDHAYNVNITWLDPNKGPLDAYGSSMGFSIESCRVTTTTHGWPTRFYANTIPPIPLDLEPGYNGFGFQLSREGGNWDVAMNQYLPGNGVSYGTVTNLGTPDSPCMIIPNGSTQPYANPALDFTEIPSVETGTVQINGMDIVLFAPGMQFAPKRSPEDASQQPTSFVWLAAFVTDTNAVNFVSFDADFTSGAGAEGLLSVYWDTNTIGSIDERVVLPGLRQYSFMFPNATDHSTHMLGFRLDTFSDAPSTVTVTNVSTGFAGIQAPFSLAFTGEKNTDGLPILQLTGPQGFNYMVEASSNLVDWTTFAILVNTNGIVRFIDTASTNATARFYRAVVH